MLSFIGALLVAGVGANVHHWPSSHSQQGSVCVVRCWVAWACAHLLPSDISDGLQTFAWLLVRRTVAPLPSMRVYTGCTHWLKSGAPMLSRLRIWCVFVQRSYQAASNPLARDMFSVQVLPDRDKHFFKAPPRANPTPPGRADTGIECCPHHTQASACRGCRRLTSVHTFCMLAASTFRSWLVRGWEPAHITEVPA